MTAPKNRILTHRLVKVAELQPHPLNWRTHPEHQRAAVLALVEEVGLARSVLAYIPDDKKPAEWEAWDRVSRAAFAADVDTGRLTLIDGHGRREWMPDEEVTVEVLDVTDDEARKLLLSLDPTAGLAGRDEEALAQLRDLTQTDNATLDAFWSGLGNDAAPKLPLETSDEPPAPEQYLILVTCRSERHQAELLDKLKKQRLTCKPLIS